MVYYGVCPSAYASRWCLLLISIYLTRMSNVKEENVCNPAAFAKNQVLFYLEPYRLLHGG